MTDNEQQRAPVSPQRRRPETPVPDAPKAKSGGKKIANSLVALGSAAIISVYGLGYVRTQPAEASLSTDSPTIAIATAAPATSAAASAPTVTTGAPRATAAPSTATSAPAPAVKVPAVATATAATMAAYKDGTYTGTGTSRHGSIAAAVVIQGGKIVSADITQCGTRYPCAKIAMLPGQVVAGQSATVDLVSGATDSSEAYQGAIKNALAKAVVAA